MKWVVYNLLFAVVYPFLLPGFLVRMLRRGGYAARMGDRFALYPRDVLARFKESSGKSELVWIHAVSVGEVQVAGQLMREWRAVDPAVRFCFSTTSSTGWKMAEKEVADGDVLIYNPLDFPNFVKSALLTVRPRAVILTESEIWPNFVRTARAMKVPVFLINARVSDRSAPRYKAAKWFFGDVLSAMARMFAQSDLDASRLIAAGAPKDKVEVTGSFKFDVAHRNEAKERELREWIGPGRILLGGSTWPGEDKVLLGIYSELVKNADKDAPLLVIAPRHFEKADAVEANIKSAGFACIRRSRKNSPAPNSPAPVYLADTTGELMGLYGIADVVFVGKSLCAHGSQNMIEPCLCGKPTAVGPFTENFRPVMSDLLSANAIVQVKDEQELSAFVKRAFDDDGGLGVRAAQAVERRRGVVAKCVATIRKALACLVLAAVVSGCGHEEKESVKEEKVPEERTFAPVKIVSACIAAVENPAATTAFLSDPRAEAFAPHIAAFGITCVSNSADIADSRYDIVFVAERADAQTLTNAYEKVSYGGVLVWRIDVKDMTAETFRDHATAFPCADAHLWMPAADEWTIVGRRTPLKRRLDEMLQLFSRDSAFETLAIAECTALSDVFASYAGNLSGIYDAFKTGDLSAKVRPEFFIEKDIPAIDWIDRGDVDDDIYRATLAEMRSMQVVRRLVVEGDMTANDGRADDATEIWARAFLRNPRDPMLLDRLDRLMRNAKALESVGNVSAAAKCYETIIVINPKDASAVLNYGLCLRKLGKKEMSDQVLERAKEIRKR
jgi:3-deoxy-D-manno-octulosonic-acid transferase